MERQRPTSLEIREQPGEFLVMDPPAINMAKLMDHTERAIQPPNWEVYQSIDGPNGRKLLKKFSPDGIVRVVETHPSYGERLTEHLYEEGVEAFSEGYLKTDKRKNYRTFVGDLFMVRYDLNGNPIPTAGNPSLAEEFGARASDIFSRGGKRWSSVKLQRYYQEHAHSYGPYSESIYTPSALRNNTTTNMDWVQSSPVIGSGFGQGADWAGAGWRRTASGGIRRPSMPHIESPIRFKTAAERKAYLEQTAEEAKKLKGKVGSISGSLIDGGVDVSAATIGSAVGGARATRGWVDNRISHARSKLPERDKVTGSIKGTVDTGVGRARSIVTGAGDLAAGVESKLTVDVPRAATEFRGRFTTAEERSAKWERDKAAANRYKENAAHAVRSSVDLGAGGTRSVVLGAGERLGDFAGRVQDGVENTRPAVGDQIAKAKASKDNLVSAAAAGIENVRSIELPHVDGFRDSLKRLFGVDKEIDGAIQVDASASVSSSESASKAKGRAVIDVFFKKLDEIKAERDRQIQMRAQVNLGKPNQPDFIATGLNKLKGAIGGFRESRANARASGEFDNWSDQDLQEFSQIASDLDNERVEAELSARAKNAKPKVGLSDRIAEGISAIQERSRATDNATRRVAEIAEAMPSVDVLGTARAAGGRTADAATALVGGVAVLGYLGAKGLGDAASFIDGEVGKVTGAMTASNKEAARRAAVKINNIENPSANIALKIKGGLAGAGAGVVKAAGSMGRGVGRVEDKIGEIGIPMVEGMARGIDKAVRLPGTAGKAGLESAQVLRDTVNERRNRGKEISLPPGVTIIEEETGVHEAARAAIRVGDDRDPDFGRAPWERSDWVPPVDPTAETKSWETPAATGAEAVSADEARSSVAVEAPPSFDLDDTVPYIVFEPHGNGNGHKVISQPIIYKGGRDQHGQFVRQKDGLNKVMEDGKDYSSLARIGEPVEA